MQIITIDDLETAASRQGDYTYAVRITGGDVLEVIKFAGRGGTDGYFAYLYRMERVTRAQAAQLMLQRAARLMVQS